MNDQLRNDRFGEEIELARQGLHPVAGVDEAGRGPLAGPVVAAAVILPPFSDALAGILADVDDSKRLTPQKRLSLFRLIQRYALTVGVGRIEAEEVDRCNILQATFRAMTGALLELDPQPRFVLVDGNLIPEGWEWPARALVKGDTRSVSIAAASIVAKVTRDRIMEKCHALYPEYDFLNNKGYGTERHLSGIERHGLSPVHRITFCRSALERRRLRLV